MVRKYNVGTKAFEGGTFEPIPDDTQLRVKIYSIEEKERPESFGEDAGKPYLEVTYKVDNPGSPYNNRELRYNDYPLYEQKSRAGNDLSWRLGMFARAFGIENDDEGNALFPDDLRDLEERYAIATIGSRTRQSDGRVFNTVPRIDKGDDPVASEDKTPSASRGGWD